MNAVEPDHFVRNDGLLSESTSLRAFGPREPSGLAPKKSKPSPPKADSLLLI